MTDTEDSKKELCALCGEKKGNENVATGPGKIRGVSSL
jgi:hypothetical protein